MFKAKKFLLDPDELDLVVEGLHMLQTALQAESKVLNEQMMNSRTDSDFDACGRALALRLDSSIAITGLLARLAPEVDQS